MPLFAALVDRVKRGRGHVAVADARDHEALGAVLDRSVDQVGAHVRVRIDHVHARQLVEASTENSVAGPTLRSIGSNHSILPVFTTPAGPRLMLTNVCTVVALVFIDVASVVNFIVQDDERALSLRARVRHDRYAVVDVARAIGTDRVAGRIEPTITTGLSLLVTSDRK